MEGRYYWKDDTTGRNFISAGKNRLDVAGEIELDLGIGGHLIKEKFWVTRNLAHAVIVGAKCLKENKIDILFSEDCVSLEGMKIPLNVSEITGVSAITEEGFQPSKAVEIDEENLSGLQARRLRELLDNYSDIFSKNDEDIGKSDFIHRIQLSSGTQSNHGRTESRTFIRLS